jgi:hypothetical protein
MRIRMRSPERAPPRVRPDATKPTPSVPRVSSNPCRCRHFLRRATLLPLRPLQRFIDSIIQQMHRAEGRGMGLAFPTTLSLSVLT